MAGTRRRVSRRKVDNSATLSKTKELMDEYIQLGVEINAAKDRMAIIEGLVTPVVKATDDDRLNSTLATAMMVTPRSNAKHVIDPKGFHKLCDSDNEFYASVTVSSTAAKKVVAEKALKKVTTTTPGATKDPVIKITARAD